MMNDQLRISSVFRDWSGLRSGCSASVVSQPSANPHRGPSGEDVQGAAPDCGAGTGTTIGAAVAPWGWSRRRLPTTGSVLEGSRRGPLDGCRPAMDEPRATEWPEACQDQDQLESPGRSARPARTFNRGIFDVPSSSARPGPEKTGVVPGVGGSGGLSSSIKGYPRVSSEIFLL